MNLASLIHGGTKENKKPALDGLWCSFVRNFSPGELTKYVEFTPNIMKKGAKVPAKVRPSSDIY